MDIDINKLDVLDNLDDILDDNIEEDISNEIDNILLNAFDNKSNQSLLNFTHDKIHKLNKDIIDAIPINNKIKKEYVQKLKKYRYIDELDELKIGSYLRWIAINDNATDLLKLNKGAIISEINITDEGIKLVLKSCCNYNLRYFQIHFDNNIIFQKLNNEEMMILSALSYISK